MEEHERFIASVQESVESLEPVDLTGLRNVLKEKLNEFSVSKLLNPSMFA